MSIPACALCGTPLTEENDSREHLIPNSLGGRRKIKGFICISCNNTCGATWDSALAEQLNPLSLYFQIQRERGHPPSQVFQTTAGEALEMTHDGTLLPAKPQFHESATSTGGKAIQLVPRSMTEARLMLKQLKRKYPGIDIEAILQSANIVSRYPEGMIGMSVVVGGKDACRSVVKTALALAVAEGIDPDSCMHAKTYLTAPECDACFDFFYGRDLVVDRPPGMPLHCVAVRGDPSTGLLLGYVEYFGAYRTAIVLSDQYTGDPIESCHAINPIAGAELSLRVDLSLSRAEAAELFQNQERPFDGFKAAIEQVISTGFKKRYENERDRVLNEAVEHAFKNCGAEEGELLTREHIGRIAALVAEKVLPFAMRFGFRPPEQE